MKRMSDLYHIESLESEGNDSTTDLIRRFKHPEISIYTINGPLFFGAASRFDQEVATAAGGHKPIKIIRMKYVPSIDATGLYFLESTYKKHKKIGGVVIFASVQPDVMKVIKKTGLYDELVGDDHFCKTTREALKHALRHAHGLHGKKKDVSDEELKKYNITQFDLEDKNVNIFATKDRDPVEGVLERMGVTKVTRITKKGLSKATKFVRD
jgi:anti-anti-sigma factor